MALWERYKYQDSYIRMGRVGFLIQKSEYNLYLFAVFGENLFRPEPHITRVKIC
jgi:hypothetical protein